MVLTREDHDTAISNSERALMAAEEGADIYVRIHANGSEDPLAKEAMAMVPLRRKSLCWEHFIRKAMRSGKL